jgi:hypothetical protein
MTNRQIFALLLATSTCVAGVMFFDYSGLSTAWQLLSTMILGSRVRQLDHDSVPGKSRLNTKVCRCALQSGDLNEN